MVSRKVPSQEVTSSKFGHIESAQDEYLELLIQHRARACADDVSITEICALLDEAKCFWLERLEIIRFELEELAEGQTCFLLSGAIYLDTSKYEHFYFKTLGDYQLLPDPLSRMQWFFRLPQDKINYEITTRYFKDAFLDALRILSDYKRAFYIIPVDELAITNAQEHDELVDEFFWQFVAAMLGKESISKEEFLGQYRNFEEIEAHLLPFFRTNLVFIDFADQSSSLREKMERYGREQANFSAELEKVSDPNRVLC